MSKLFYLFSFLLIASLHVIAQPAFITSAPPVKLAYKTCKLVDLVQAPDEKCVLVQLALKEDEIHFTEFSKDLKVIRTGKSPFTLDDGKQYVRILKFKEKSYLLWEQPVKKTKQDVVMMQEILTSELKLREPAIMLDKSNTEISWYMFTSTSYDNLSTEHNETGAHHLYMSPDKKNILSVSLKKPSRDKEDVNTFFMDVLDQNGISVYSREAKFPYDRKKMQPIAYCLANDKAVYGLYRVFKGETRDAEKNDSIPNFNFEIYKYDQATESKVCEIKTAGVFPAQTLMFEINSKNDPMVAGMYGKYGKIYMTDAIAFYQGAYLVKVDHNKPGAVYEMNNLSVLPPDLIAANSPYVSKPLFKSGHRAFASKVPPGAEIMDRQDAVQGLDLLQMYFDKEGQISILTQKQYTTQRVVDYSYSYSFGGRYEPKTFAHDFFWYDSYILRFDKDGKPLKTIKIPKNESARDTRHSMGFMLHDHAGRPQLAYMDNEANDKLAKESVPALYRDGTPGTLHIKNIDQQGEMVEVMNYKVTNPLEVPAIAGIYVTSGNQYYGLKLSATFCRICTFSFPE